MAEAVPVFASPAISINKIEIDQPWQWLTRGWSDLRRSPTVSITYGVLAAVTGYLITAGLFWADMIYLVLPMTAGFLIVGPILAVGLYEASRRAQQDQQTTLSQAFLAINQNRSQIMLMGVALLLLMFAWARGAAILFFLYFGLEPPSFENLIVNTFLTADSIPFLIIGSLVGGVFATAAFAISVVSIPFLLDRPNANVVEAIATSVRAVQTNPKALAFWATLIVVFIAAGLVTLYLGLILTLPLIGHASWHAYKDLVKHPD